MTIKDAVVLIAGNALQNVLYVFVFVVAQNLISQLSTTGGVWWRHIRFRPAAPRRCLSGTRARCCTSTSSRTRSGSTGWRSWCGWSSVWSATVCRPWSGCSAACVVTTLRPSTSPLCPSTVSRFSSSTRSTRSSSSSTYTSTIYPSSARSLIENGEFYTFEKFVKN